jgi:UbiA prenyltransferase family protein
MSSAETVRPTLPAWRAWLQIARVSNTPTVVSNTVAGAVLASTVAETGTVVLVAAAMALFYTAGMVLNDLADADIDRRQRPERPIPSGAIGPRAALAAFCVLAVAGLVLVATEGLAPLLAAIGLVGLIVLYDLWHKGNPISPALMAGCRALVYVIAGLAVADDLPGELWGAAAVLFAYVVGLTQVAKLEGGGVLGLWPAAAVLASVVYWTVMFDAEGAWWFVYTAFVVWTVLALLTARRGRVGKAVAGLIAGIALFDAVAVASVDGSDAAVAACLAAFVATIALQTKISGT